MKVYILPLAIDNDATTVHMAYTVLLRNFMNMNGVSSDARNFTTPSMMDWYSGDISFPVFSDANCQMKISQQLKLNIFLSKYLHKCICICTNGIYTRYTDHNLQNAHTSVWPQEGWWYKEMKLAAMVVIFYFPRSNFCHLNDGLHFCPPDSLIFATVEHKGLSVTRSSFIDKL